MLRGREIGCVLLALTLSAPGAHGQTAKAPATGPRVLLVSPPQASVSSVSPAEIVREIDDPCTSDRWLLVRDDRYPGGPGRLLRLAARVNGATSVREAKAAPDAIADGLAPGPPPAIRAGDRVIVEENTPVVEARLDAVALGPAAIGSPFHARLAIGGKVVRALAEAPGRAVLREGPEGHR